MLVRVLYTGIYSSAPLDLSLLFLLSAPNPLEQQLNSLSFYQVNDSELQSIESEAS
jgi:hypothetical protein